MSKQQIKKEIQKLQRTIKNAPRILEFRGRRVVSAYKWKWMDWSTLPDGYHLLVIWNNKKDFPEDWLRDYADLLHKVQDPQYGKMLCGKCMINLMQEAKHDIERFRAYWDEHGGEAAKKRHLEEMGERYRSSSLKEEAMREVRYRIHGGDGEEPTCNVINYFKCPYSEDRDTLIEYGSMNKQLWKHIVWYDTHWNRNPSIEHPASEMKWYHFDEPPILDVTDYNDIEKAMEDGRLKRIVEEHERYTKETGHEIWNT